jgi:two-component system phosphate regulon response regulator PhoB
MTPPRILVVEDEQDIAGLIKHALEREGGFVIDIAGSGDAALKCVAEELPDLVLLDLNLPVLNGVEVCRIMRGRTETAKVPIIMLTARSTESDRITGLDIGADDYITKPFSPRELVARVKAVLRRFERPLAPSVLTVGEVQIDSGAMTLMVRGKQVATTATEFRLLEYLARHPGRVFTRDQLLDAVWRDTAFVTPRSVDVYVRRIREKIEPNADEPRYLRTVRGAGYRFETMK